MALSDIELQDILSGLSEEQQKQLFEQLGKKFNEPIILFYLSVKVLDTNITKDNPIPINLISGTGYDPNYTTLLKYVLNDIDNKYIITKCNEYTY